MPRKKSTDAFADAPSGDDEKDDQLKFGLPQSTYQLNSDIAVVAERVIRNYPVSLGHLVNVPLAFLRRSSRRTDEEFAVDKAGHAFIRSDRERGIDPTFQAGIWFQGNVWDKFSPDQRQAWVHHQLLHLQVTSTGKLKLTGHEAEEFADVLRVYGVWTDQLKLAFEQADAHEGPAAKADLSVQPGVEVKTRFPYTTPPAAPQPN